MFLGHYHEGHTTWRHIVWSPEKGRKDDKRGMTDKRAKKCVGIVCRNDARFSTKRLLGLK